MFILWGLHYLDEVTGAWAANGYRACPFEICLNPGMDILSCQGFLANCTNANKLIPGDIF